MIIKFENTYCEEISEQQAISLNMYIKAYYNNSFLKKRETYSFGKLSYLEYSKKIGETDSQIISSILPLSIIFSIVQFETVLANYVLKNSSDYNESGILTSKSNELFDTNNNRIAVETINNLVSGIPDYSQTEKRYFDKSLISDDEIFNCIYNLDGSLDYIYYSGLHTNTDEQDSEEFDESPSSIQRLMSLTGISQQLMNYYLSPNVIPQ